MYMGTLSKGVPNPSAFMMLEKNVTSFIANAVVTSSACMVDCAVSPCNLNLKLTGPFERNAR